jgi:hypothetical protein
MGPLGRGILVAGAATVLWLAGPVNPPWAIASSDGPVTVVFAVARLGLMAVAAFWLLLLSSAAVGFVHIHGPKAVRVVAGSWLIAASPAGPALAGPGVRPSPGPAPVLIAPGAEAAPADIPRTVRPPRPIRVARTRPRIGRRWWTVRPGDNLWVIAEAVLAAHLERGPSDQEVAQYWLSVIAANRSRLPDPADPSLLFPGDTVVLPSPGTLLSWPAGS